VCYVSDGFVMVVCWTYACVLFEFERCVFSDWFQLMCV
jgi:hypothetical protein